MDIERVCPGCSQRYGWAETPTGEYICEYCHSGWRNDPKLNPPTWEKAENLGAADWGSFLRVKEAVDGFRRTF